MNLRFIQRVTHFVRKNAGGEARDEFCDVYEVGGVQDVVVDVYIIAEEGQLVGRVAMRTRTDSERRCFGYTLYFKFLNNPPTSGRQPAND